jgi:transcriptional regulator with XRE-family HTH domain
MTYGTRLKQAIANRGRTRAALGDAIGCTVQSISQVITGGRTGRQEFTPENTTRAARFLGVNARWLSTGDGPMMDVRQPDHRAVEVDPTGVNLEMSQLALLLSAIPAERRMQAYVAATQTMISYLRPQAASGGASDAENEHEPSFSRAPAATTTSMSE